MRFVARSVTISVSPSSSKPICAAAVEAALRGRFDPGIGLSRPFTSTVKPLTPLGTPAFRT